MMDKQALLKRVTVNPKVFGGKPVVRGRRLAVEHVMDMLAAGDTPDSLLKAYPWLEQEDIEACILFEKELKGKEIRY